MACLLAGFASLALPPPGVAADVTPPPFEKLRYDEDYAWLRDPSRRSGPLDRFKFIPLSAGGDVHLSIGGEVRERYEFTDDPAWGDDPQDRRGVFLQRYILHGEMQAGERVRLFAQLFSALADGRAGGPSPVDENELKVENAFLDLMFPLAKDRRLTVRGGRQEAAYGSGRIVDVREGPNVRRTFDGGRLLLTLPAWRVDLLALRPAEDDPGVFGDGTDRTRALWGIYAAGHPGRLPAGSLDLYYLGYRDEGGRFAQGTAEETRHSLGVRLWGEAGGWDWNGEALWQWGSFGRGEIRAWTVASLIGYTWHDAPLKPRAGLSANVASGDRDPDDPDLQTFNPLFPRGNYFSELALLGPRNFWNFAPSLVLHPADGVSLTTDLNFFWRLRTADGIYAPSGRLLRQGIGTDERFVGSTLSLTAEWQVNRHLALTAIYSHFFPGDFIRATGSAEDIDFHEFTATFRF
jgi:hypothetical protein